MEYKLGEIYDELTPELVDWCNNSRIYYAHAFKNENGVYKYQIRMFVETDEEKKDRLRFRRQSICFPIINRGALWYETLTDAQKRELQVWYREWLDVTETMEEPIKPEWLK